MSRGYQYPVTDDAMEPRIANGEIVLADPDWPCNEGNDVVVTTTDGNRLIRTLLRQSELHVRLGATNDMYPDIELRRSEIEAMEFVCGYSAKGHRLQ